MSTARMGGELNRSGKNFKFLLALSAIQGWRRICHVRSQHEVEQPESSFRRTFKQLSFLQAAAAVEQARVEVQR